MAKWEWLRGGADLDTAKGVVGAAALTETYTPVRISSNTLLAINAEGQQVFGVCKTEQDANATKAPVIMSNDYFRVPFTGALNFGDQVMITADGETVKKLSQVSGLRYPCGVVVDFAPYQALTPSETAAFCTIKAIFYNAYAMTEGDVVVDDLQAAIGTIGDLETTATDLVEAVNEVKVTADGAQPLTGGTLDDSAGVVEIVAGSTNGAAFGDTGDKIAFRGVTPIVLPAHADQAACPAGGTGATEGAWDTAAHRDAAVALINQMRDVLINHGLMKGSA